MAFIQHLPEIWASFRGKFVDDVMKGGRKGVRERVGEYV